MPAEESPRLKALLIGVNYVDREAYGGRTDGRLSCPEADAAAMEAFLTWRSGCRGGHT